MYFTKKQNSTENWKSQYISVLSQKMIPLNLNEIGQ